MFNFDVGTKLNTNDYGELTIYKKDRTRFYLQDKYGKILGNVVKQNIIGLI